ncbi:MAG: DUF6688 family protein [Acidobacteriota bacterium]
MHDDITDAPETLTVTIDDSPTDTDPTGMTRAEIFPDGWIDRLWFAWVTVLVPAVSFGLSSQGLSLIDWQKPTLGTWAALLLDQDGTRVFIPWAILIVGFCLLLVVRPGSWTKTPLARLVFGLGLLFALPFGMATLGVVLLSEQDDVAIGLAWVLAAWVVVDLVSIGVVRGLRRIGRWLAGRLGRRRLALGIVGALVLTWLVAVAWMAVESTHTSVSEAMLQASVGPVAFFFFVSLALGPIWSARALWRLQRCLGPIGPIDRWSLATIVVAIAGYVVAWRLAVRDIVQAYDALPAQPPDCFVATAAAQGPRRWVGGTLATTGTDGQRQITPQLQRIKLFELLWMTASPASHRGFRHVYDRLGPPVAATIRGPISAMLAWLVLKPAEWLAAASTRLVLGRAASRWRRRLYRGSDRRDRRCPLRGGPRFEAIAEETDLDPHQGLHRLTVDRQAGGRLVLVGTGDEEGAPRAVDAGDRGRHECPDRSRIEGARNAVTDRPDLP